MANVAFDTLTVSKDLQAAGFDMLHAEAIALAVKQGQGELASKQDVALLEAKIDQSNTDLNSKIDQLRTELKADKSELKSAINQLSTDLNSKIDQSNTDLNSKIDQSNTDLNSKIDQLRISIFWLKWTVGVVIGLSLANLGAILVQ